MGFYDLEIISSSSLLAKTMPYERPILLWI